MMCPKCAGKTKVIGVTDGAIRERFRKCTVCGHTFQTVEAVKFDDFWREYAKDSVELNKEQFEKKEKKNGQ